ncbi:MAG TPA: hypothetical protein VLS89_13990 [Candidatus Nanopelagicales bacterium]|nr:hypothetical protein [Candidatus Nanopelagicales bacterium]
MFRNRPTLAAEMLRQALGQALPRFSAARVESADLAEVAPVDRRADLVLVLTDENHRPVQSIVVEVQLNPDPDKPYIWLVYLGQARAQHRCPTLLLVVTIDEKMVRWCSRPIETGHPGLTLTPLVLGPEGVPVVTDPEQARVAPELAVLSAMAHGRGEAGEAIGRAFWAAVVGLEEDRRAVYWDLMLSSLHEAARRWLEEKMRGYEFQSEFARTYVAKGREEGKLEGKLEGIKEGSLNTEARAVLIVLEARGLEVPPDVRERVLGSTDLAELERWLRRAAVVGEARELFATTAS